MTPDGITQGSLLDGRVRHDQFAHGHRAGLEPVLLAALVPALPGERVLEAGSGSGAGLLCLAARVPNVLGMGIEIDPALVALATANATANGFAGLQFVAQAIESFAREASFDQAFSNPPWRDADGTASPDAARDLARRTREGQLALWIAALARSLRHRGTLTLAVGVAAVPECMSALAASGVGGVRLLPLWPKAGQAAKLILIQARRGARTPMRLDAGLVLHTADGGFTPEANAILRGGGAISA